MEVYEWLNENALRSYPLLEDADKHSSTLTSYGLPDDFIVDLQLVADSLISGEVLLTEISVTAGRSVTVTFSTGAEFSITAIDTTTYPVYCRLPEGSLAVFGEGLKSLPVGDHTLAFAVPVEPCCVVEFCNAWLGVSSVGVLPNIEAYQSIGRAPLLDGVNGLVALAKPTPLLSGNVQFRAGYNFRVGVSNNLIDLEAGAGLGLKVNCTTAFVPFAVKDCSSIISYINGVPPDSNGKFSLAAGSNINIIDGVTLSDEFYDTIDTAGTGISAKDHTLFVGLTFLQTDLCAPVNLTPTL